MILSEYCSSQTICNSTSCIESDIGAIRYICTDRVNLCNIDCNTGCSNVIIESSATITRINCMNSNSCTNIQLFCGYNSNINNVEMTECKLNCGDSDSCNNINVECNGNIANCGIGPLSFNSNTNINAIDGDLICNLSESSNICSLDCGSNGAICDVGKTSTITCTANNIGLCSCINPCGSNVNIIQLTAIPSHITLNPSFNPTIYPTNNPIIITSSSLSPTYTPSITPISSTNITPSPSISPTNNVIMTSSKEAINSPLTSTSTPSNIPSTSPISVDVPSKSLLIGIPTISPMIEIITNSPTKAPYITVINSNKSFFEEHILFIIIIGSIMLLCICCIIILLLYKIKRLHNIKKERESHKMVEHVNMSIIPITSNDDDEDTIIPINDNSHSIKKQQNNNNKINHSKERSTSVMIKKYLNAQKMERIGNVSPTVSNEANETDLETSINNFTAAASQVIDTRSMSMQTQISRNQQAQSISKPKQSHSNTRGLSEITMSDIIQEMDTPEHEYGHFDPIKYYSNTQRQHIKQIQRKEKGLKTADNEPILDVTESDNMIPNPPQIIAMQGAHKSTFDRNLDDVVNTNEMLMGNVVRDMAKSRYQKQPNLSPVMVPLKSDKNDDIMHNPPQISMGKQHKSTFDRNLDDVINTNEILMGNVVRDMAKSRYQKQQKQEEETQIIPLKGGNNNNNNDITHNPPQIPMKTAHKSTFDKNLDDVVSTNEILMGNVVRDMAKSRYKKQQKLSPKTVALKGGNNNNDDITHNPPQISMNAAHKSTFDRNLDDVVNTNEMLMGNVVRDMAKSRLKVYGFEKDKPRDKASLDEFVPPSPENTFSAMQMSFNTKLHTTTYSQDLLMDDILNDIAKKENKFSGGH